MIGQPDHSSGPGQCCRVELVSRRDDGLMLSVSNFVYDVRRGRAHYDRNEPRDSLPSRCGGN